MLGPVSRFPLGLLDLFGVKQMGAYPGEISQGYQPTLDLLRMVAQANSETTLIGLPVNLAGVATAPTGTFPVLVDGVNQLRTLQNECMFITAWHLQHTVNGAGGIVPDAKFVMDSASGGQRIAFGRGEGSFATAGVAGETITFANANEDTMIYVPPGFNINIVTCSNAVSVAAGDVRIATCLRFLKLRV